MESKTFIWAAIVFFLFPGLIQPGEDQNTIKIAFTGDVMLSRRVAQEAEHTGIPPWKNILPSLGSFDYLIGNFEGAIGDPVNLTSTKNNPLCFSISKERLLPWGMFPFQAVTLENNHSLDLGLDGKIETIQCLGSQGVGTFTWEKSPNIFEVKGRKIAVIPLNTIISRDKPQELRQKLELIPQKISLAQTLAELVVISVHWGYELRDWPDKDMIESGRWFIDLGADMVVGHHPHVIIPPEVYKNRPIFYSLGNFIFDQKYKTSKQGSIAACRIQGNKVSFETYTVSTPFNSSFPQSVASDEPYTEDLKQAEFQINKNKLKFHYLTVILDKTKNSGESIISIVKNENIRWQSPPLPVRSAFKTRLRPELDEDILILLLGMYSPLDRETAPRVYVYSVTEHGLRALWRGSALAWPLVDIFLVESGGIDYLCAFHRGDSYLVLDPPTSKRKLAYYLWNGFGFNLKDDVPKAVKTAAQKRWRYIDR